jgi:hypothetical protein
MLLATPGIFLTANFFVVFNRQMNLTNAALTELD